MVGINSITLISPVVSCEGTQDKNNGNENFRKMLDFQLSSSRKNKKAEEPEEIPSQKQFHYELGLIQIMTSNNNEIKKEKEEKKK